MQGYLARDRNWTLEIPIWIPGYRGNYTYGDVTLEGEDGVELGEPTNPIEPPGEAPDEGGNIFSRLFTSSTYLKFFFMGKVQYIKDKFIAQIDGFRGSIGSSIDFKLNNSEVATAKYSANLARLFLGYSFYELENKSETIRWTIYGYTGMRVHHVELFSTLNRTTDELDIDVVWSEGIFGVGNRIALKDWLFILQGDMGGFYTNRNYSYMISLYCYYRLSDLLSIKVGWTDWEIQHKRELRGEKFSLNVHLSGPNMGITFHF